MRKKDNPARYPNAKPLNNRLRLEMQGLGNQRAAKSGNIQTHTRAPQLNPG